jgi:hypothetical protein
MPTNERTLQALKNIAENLDRLGVKGEDLKILKGHIREQSKQVNKWYINKYGRDSYKKIRR